MATPRTVYESAHLVVTHDDATNILRVVRTAAPITPGPSFQREAATITAALGPFDGARVGLLFDVRDSPLRNDPDYEDGVSAARKRLFGRFRHTAILVRTAVGRLQVGRLAKQDGRAAAVFQNEDEAVAHLQQAVRGG